MWDGDGTGGTGGAGGAPAGGAGGAGGAAGAGGGAGDGAAGAAARPDWLPEAYWKDGQADYQGLATAHAQLAEQHKPFAERLAARPATPADYQLPDLKDSAPPGFDPQLVDKAPIMEWWRTLAHETGLSADQFGEGVKQLTTYMGQLMTVDTQAELAALGADGSQRQEKLTLWRDNTVPDEHKEIVSALLDTGAGIKFLEWANQQAGTNLGTRSPLPQGGAGETSEQALERANKIMGEPDYFANADKQKQVGEIYKRVFPGTISASGGAGPAAIIRQ
jgi:hypothetical protein